MDVRGNDEINERVMQIMRTTMISMMRVNCRILEFYYDSIDIFFVKETVPEE